MKYCSTRGKIKGLEFEDVLFSGFLADGGMALPETIPKVERDILKSWAGLSYKDIVLKIVPLFVPEEILPLDEFSKMVDRALQTFDTPEIAPLARLAGGLNVLELFHGVTWAFKDLAMTILGQIFDFILSRRQKHLTIVCSTSGDTGSSAIEAVRGLKLVDIVVVLPRGRCAQIQELQMTTVKADNVFVYRADGTADDGDRAVKQLFLDVEFATKHNLCSANSLNWARVLLQIPAFFYAYLKMCPSCEGEVEMVLPTGGGGNTVAGLVARRMGLPVSLACALNTNDVVARMVNTGVCRLNDVTPSLAPAMDNQWAYNFERVWYLCSNGDASLVDKMMREVEKTGHTTLPMEIQKQMQSEIGTCVTDDDGIKRAMKRCWDENHYTLCPHTATAAAYHFSETDKGQTSNTARVCVATASPLKFREAVEAAGLKPLESPRLKQLLTSPTFSQDLEQGQDWVEILKHRIQVMSQNFAHRSKK